VRLQRMGVVCLAALLAAGCSHSAADPSNGEHSGGSSYSASISAQPKAGSPAFCMKLAQSKAVHNLQAELTAAAEQPATGAAQLAAAAGALTQIVSAAPTTLRASLTSAAAALRLLARDRTQSPGAVQKVGATLAQLGQEVQKPCGFPVG
jgi:hypothetical protein